MSSEHMVHRTFEEMLPEHISGKLDTGRKVSLERHLASCAECSARRKELESLFALVATASMSQPPKHYFSTLVPRVRRRMEKKTDFETSLAARILAPLTALVVVVGLVANLSVDSGGKGLRTLVGSLTTDELAEIAADQSEQLMGSLESLASAVSERSITLKLGTAVFAEDDLPVVATVADLDDNDLEMLLQKLRERTIL